MIHRGSKLTLRTQLEKVLIFRHIFTYLFTSLFLVKKFFKHINKDMITRLFLTELEKVIIFRHTFPSLTGVPIDLHGTA